MVRVLLHNNFLAILLHELLRDFHLLFLLLRLRQNWQWYDQRLLSNIHLPYCGLALFKVWLQEGSFSSDVA